MKAETIVFGGGCFWCTEAVFKMLKGVSAVDPGYAGGKEINPTYDDVASGRTGHTECVRVEYHSAEVKFRDLLTVFFGSHDPTSLNKQDNDAGTQYRSAIFYTTEGQRQITEDFIQEINNSNPVGKKIVTEVVPLDKFYVAENYHKDFYERNKDAPYCDIIINPKLQKVQKNFSELLKNNQ